MPAPGGVELHQPCIGAVQDHGLEGGVFHQRDLVLVRVEGRISATIPEPKGRNQAREQQTKGPASRPEADQPLAGHL